MRVSDVSVDVLYLRQLPLRHLNQLGTVQVTVATHGSVPSQRPPMPFSLHGASSPAFSPPCSTLLPLPPQGPAIPLLPAYCHWMMMAGMMGMMVEFCGTCRCPFFFLKPILLQCAKKGRKNRKEKEISKDKRERVVGNKDRKKKKG